MLNEIQNKPQRLDEEHSMSLREKYENPESNRPVRPSQAPHICEMTKFPQMLFYENKEKKGPRHKNPDFDDARLDLNLMLGTWYNEKTKFLFEPVPPESEFYSTSVDTEIPNVFVIEKNEAFEGFIRQGAVRPLEKEFYFQRTTLQTHPNNDSYNCLFLFQLSFSFLF